VDLLYTHSVDESVRENEIVIRPTHAHKLSHKSLNLIEELSMTWTMQWDSEIELREWKDQLFADDEKSRRHNVPTEMDCSIFIASWNMGNAPPPADIERWIPMRGRTTCDIYAIGLQESTWGGIWQAL